MAYIEKISKEQFYHLYIELCLSQKDIADKFNVSINYIRNLVKKYNMKKDLNLRFKTYKLKTGYDSPLHNPEVQQKARDSFTRRTGYSSVASDPEVKRKKKETYESRTGYNNPSQNPEVKVKKIKTSLEHFGVSNPSKDPCIRKKIQESYIERYGYSHPMKNPEILKRAQAKMKVTLLKTTGFDNSNKNPKTREKRYATLKKNNTFSSSSYEKRAIILLKEKFEDVKVQYSSKVYPFHCDFYIPEKDLYIELQICWTHGKMPYQQCDKKCKEQLEIWKEKSKRSKFYQAAIDTWTIRDVKKRETAYKNNLNYIEFFDYKDFEAWFDNFNNDKGN